MVTKTAIVIPMLDEIAHLESLLQALEKQTYTPDEIIFVDAGSTDGSLEFVLDWWEKHATKIENRRVISRDGAFPGEARNFGIKSTSSDWIAFLDCGIVPEQDWLEALIRCCEKGIKAVFGDCIFVPKGNRIAKLICALSYGGRKHWNVLAASMVHRSVFESIGDFREDLRSAEDIEWLGRFQGRYGEGFTCPKAKVTYSNFPETIAEAVVKWYLYARNTVRAGVLRRQQLIVCAIWTALIASFSIKMSGALLLILAYSALRGLGLPILRGGTRWIFSSLASLPLSLFLGLTLDFVKFVGFLTEYTFKLKAAALKT